MVTGNNCYIADGRNYIIRESTVFMLIECKKKVMILNFAQFSGKGRHALR